MLLNTRCILAVCSTGLLNIMALNLSSVLKMAVKCAEHKSTGTSQSTRVN